MATSALCRHMISTVCNGWDHQKVLAPSTVSGLVCGYIVSNCASITASNVVNYIHKNGKTLWWQLLAWLINRWPHRHCVCICQKCVTVPLHVQLSLCLQVVAYIHWVTDIKPMIHSPTNTQGLTYNHRANIRRTTVQKQTPSVHIHGVHTFHCVHTRTHRTAFVYVYRRCLLSVSCPTFSCIKSCVKCVPIQNFSSPRKALFIHKTNSITLLHTPKTRQ